MESIEHTIEDIKVIEQDIEKIDENCKKIIVPRFTIALWLFLNYYMIYLDVVGTRMIN
jgi:hypothetical protein